MPIWNTSNYQQRQALRQAQTEPHWVINPDTGEEFYLRKAGGLMASMLSAYLPNSLTKEAVEAWEKEGVQGADVSELADRLTPEQRAAGVRETVTVARITQEMCVIPFLSNQVPEEVELTAEWKAAATVGMKQKDPKFDPNTFDFRSLIFDPQYLDDEDAMFLMKWAKGLGVGVNTKGGVVRTGNFPAVRQKLNRGTRASANKPKVQQAS